MRLLVVLLAGALLFALPEVGLAHGPAQIAAEFHDREPYFQAIAKPAPDFVLQDADGNAIQLNHFAGKVVVLNFIYATCPDVCPLHSEMIANIQRLTADAGMTDGVQFVSITTDPANDTTEIMRGYGAIHGLDSANWIFLTLAPGQPEGLTRQLAEAYGHGFTPTDGGYQVHGTVTHIIGKDGNWEANFHGLEPDPLNVVLFLNALANHWSEDPEPKSWWRRLLDRF
jgi:protein SCO1/2